MITASQLLRDREASSLWTIGPETTVSQALELMADKGIGALPVVEGNKLIGIFSERDFAREAILRDCLQLPVRDLMTHDVITIGPDQSIEECMSLVTDERIRHLPVLDHGKLIGLVSIGDIVKTIIDMQKSTIDNLENYILGEGYGH